MSRIIDELKEIQDIQSKLEFSTYEEGIIVDASGLGDDIIGDGPNVWIVSKDGPEWAIPVLGVCGPLELLVCSIASTYRGRVNG